MTRRYVGLNKTFQPCWIDSLKKSTKMYHFMGNPSQVTTHNLQQTHQKEEGGVEISTKSDAENRTQSQLQTAAAAQRCYSPAAVFALLSCSRRSSSSLSFALVPPNHPSKIGLPVVACLLLATDRRPSTAWKVKGASQPKLCFIELRENDKKGVRGIWFSASGYTVY